MKILPARTLGLDVTELSNDYIVLAVEDRVLSAGNAQGSPPGEKIETMSKVTDCNIRYFTCELE